MLGTVLGWKFNHVPGIRTEEQEDGSFLVTQWPVSLGSAPTPTQIQEWTAEYEAAQPPEFHWLTASESERNEEMRTRLGIPD